MNSITIGNSKLTSAQINSVLSGEKVNKVMTIWDKIKDCFHISDKKQVMTLLYDVYYNPDVSFLDKLDKFKELRNLSLNDYKDTFNIKIDNNVFYFEIGYIQNGTHISQSYFEIDCSEKQRNNIINNQSIKSLFNQPLKMDINNIELMVVNDVNKTNEMENKSAEEKIELIRSNLSLLLNDNVYRDEKLDSFKKGNSILNKFLSGKKCIEIKEKYAMDEVWEIIKESRNEKYNDYYISLLINNIFNDKIHSTYNIIYSYLSLKEILNKDRKILDVEFTPEKVTFFLLDENNNKIISNAHSNITQKFDLDFAAFENIINNKNLYNNATSKEDEGNLNNFLSTYNILSEKLNEKDKSELFMNMLLLNKKNTILSEKLELVKSISKQYNDSNIDKKLDIKINKEKQIKFNIKTGGMKEDNVLKFIIPNDNNLDLININNFNNGDLSIENKISILSNLDEYNRNSTILKIFYYHNLNKSSELKEELKKEFDGIIEPLLLDEKKINIFEISTEQKAIIENLPKSIGIYSIEQINEVFKYYNDILFIKRLDLQDIDNNNEYIINSKIDNLISNGNNKKETISKEFFDELNKTIPENITEKLKKIETESKINILSLNKINTENLNEEKYLDTLFSGKFNEIIRKNYNDKTDLLKIKVDKKSEKNEDIIKIRVSEKRTQGFLINTIKEYIESPANFLANKLSNSTEKVESILRLKDIDLSLLEEINYQMSVLMKDITEKQNENDLNDIKKLLLKYKNNSEMISNNANINKFAKKEKDTTGSIINDSALNVALLDNINMLDNLLSEKYMDLKYKKDKKENDKLVKEKQISEDLLSVNPLLYSGLEIIIKINRKIKNKPEVEISGHYNQIRL
ncbi:hypothetical protein [Proteus sp. CD3]|uniref:hypothetical protein n=1 Tax=Proteus sp. CD3 TaxID=1921565 RepID=UPI00124AE358|nr:hypothetical protein [Proteus sp. CD3]QEZ92209.1 hypothetical protein BTA34_07535 [Proteus sp. CD3]